MLGEGKILEELWSLQLVAAELGNLAGLEFKVRVQGLGFKGSSPGFRGQGLRLKG